jgi:DNA processing protein
MIYFLYMEDIRILSIKEIPPQLLEIPQPPKKLFIRGTLPDASYTYLAVIGSRKHTSYGRDMCERLIRGLKGYPIAIVSGLALGIDTIAHTTALDVGLPTVAFPGSGLDRNVLYPRTNILLAEKIIAQGGCCISEMEPHEKAMVYSFPQRNRLMAGIARAVLVIEAEEKSGTRITARMAIDYNRDVLAVPGSALSSNSKGTHALIRQGATPVTTSEEILEALGYTPTEHHDDRLRYKDCGPDELRVLEFLREPQERDVLIRLCGFDIARANALLSIMEIKDLIREELGEIHKI